MLYGGVDGRYAALAPPSHVLRASIATKSPLRRECFPVAVFRLQVGWGMQHGICIGSVCLPSLYHHIGSLS